MLQGRLWLQISSYFVLIMVQWEEVETCCPSLYAVIGVTALGGLCNTSHMCVLMHKVNKTGTHLQKNGSMVLLEVTKLQSVCLTGIGKQV